MQCLVKIDFYFTNIHVIGTNSVEINYLSNQQRNSDLKVQKRVDYLGSLLNSQGKYCVCIENGDYG